MNEENQKPKLLIAGAPSFSGEGLRAAINKMSEIGRGARYGLIAFKEENEFRFPPFKPVALKLELSKPETMKEKAEKNFPLPAAALETLKAFKKRNFQPKADGYFSGLITHKSVLSAAKIHETVGSLRLALIQKFEVETPEVCLEILVRVSGFGEARIKKLLKKERRRNEEKGTPKPEAEVYASVYMKLIQLKAQKSFMTNISALIQTELLFPKKSNHNL